MQIKRTPCRVYAAAVFLALLFSVFTGFAASAEDLPEEPPCVYVSIADANGKAALACLEILLEDADGDGFLTVHDALFAAHEQQFDGGAEAGFATEQAENGRIATMLWGANDSRTAVYVNHVPVEDLLAPVQDGDRLYGFVFGETEDASYCYFDLSHTSVRDGEPLVLTLTALGPDEEAQPVSDAVIQIDGKDTAFRTDGDGKVTLQFDGSGSCVVSARKDGAALMPPICTVAVSEEEPSAGDRSAVLRWLLLSVGALAGIVLALRWRVRRTDPL